MDTKHHDKGKKILSALFVIALLSFVFWSAWKIRDLKFIIIFGPVAAVIIIVYLRFEENRLEKKKQRAISKS